MRICFVCLGNICRSPTAEGVFKKVATDRGMDDRIEVDSAGTGDWHAGEEADPRARRAAESRGVTLESRARQFKTKDFDAFDFVIAMDRSNKANLEKLARSAEHRQKIYLFRDFDEQAGADSEVPDPYYGGEQGFEEILDMCERASIGLLEFVERKQKSA